MLVVHPTGNPHKRWSIPKGLPYYDEYTESCEDHYDAAVRELREETGLVIDKYTYEMYDLGIIDYNNKPKSLHGFAFFLDSVVKDVLFCSSYFSHKVYQIHLPEVDGFEWVDVPEALRMIQREQRKLFTGFTR